MASLTYYQTGLGLERSSQAFNLGIAISRRLKLKTGRSHTISLHGAGTLHTQGSTGGELLHPRHAGDHNLDRRALENQSSFRGDPRRCLVIETYELQAPKHQIDISQSVSLHTGNSGVLDEIWGARERSWQGSISSWGGEDSTQF